MIKNILLILILLAGLYLIYLMYFSIGFPYVSTSNIVPRDISSELAIITDFIDNAEMPEENETKIHIINAIEHAKNSWSECQNLVNSRKIRMFIAKNATMANWSDSKTGIIFHFFFLTKKGEIHQCSKRVPTDLKSNNIYSYQLLFNDELNIKWFKNFSNSEDIHFYSSGLIENVVCETPDGKKYYAEWSEDGKIIRSGAK